MDMNGNIHKCKALLDSGAQSNFISPSLVKKLQLTCQNVSCEIVGVGSTLTSQKTDLEITTLHSSSSLTLTCLVLKSLPVSLPPFPESLLDALLLKYPDLFKLNLADPTFAKGSSIDLILNSKLVWSLIHPERILIKEEEIILQNTFFGWIVVSGLPEEQFLGANNSFKLFLGVEKLSKIYSHLEKFWTIENCDDLPHSTYPNECEQLFINTTAQDSSGKFIVKLPFKMDPTALGNSESLARKRLFYLERKFSKDHKLKTAYIEFMREYEDLGHMSEVPIDQYNKTPSYYIPHLGVIRESSLTTKLRVVYDASAKSTTGLSLNDILHSGPTIQDELFAIILRFREYPVVISGDITKMYRQTWVHKEHRDFQRILWREDPSQPIKKFRLNTVTYGTTPAPFLAIRSLRETAIRNKDKFPKAAVSILSSFYVDDYLGGGDNIQEARQLKNDVEVVVKTGGYELRKWVSNKSEVFRSLDGSKQSPEPLYFNNSEEVKTLGITWYPLSDKFAFKSLKFDQLNDPTKRSILSESSKLFDPLGLVSPIIIRAKFILQELWQSKQEWDKPASSTLSGKWIQLRNELPLLQNLNIPRHLILFSNTSEFIIHGFGDASTKGYGACLYAVCLNNGKRTSNLICSKSRVAPLKEITLPRLELSAALLLTKLLNKVIDSFKNKPSAIFLWSDSSIVIHWISNPYKNWEIFVANRVSKIQHVKNELNLSWMHVPSGDNPADLISRGTSVSQITDSKLWWNGPSWLLLNQDEWPQPAFSLPTVLPGMKPQKVILFAGITVPSSLMIKFSSITKIFRILAYCQRFIHNANPKHKHIRKTGELTASEIESATVLCIKSVQGECFGKEIVELSKADGCLQKSSNIRTLHPIISKDGILRVGGRLQNSELTESAKHPAIIPMKHRFTELIFQNEHRKSLHAPPNLLLSKIRQRFWPLKGRIIAKRTVSNCLMCARIRPKSLAQKMAPLPLSRVTVSATFTNVGIDFAGPVLVKTSRRKNAPLIKVFICVFACFATKAVHFEVLQDLTAVSFLSGLKKFTSRRGFPSCIHSDNAKTFVGTNRTLQKLFNSMHNNPEVANFLSSQGIEWKFSPPYAPHHGGLWEAAIKSFKYHFRRVVRNSLISLDEFITLSTQIEAIMNSRPLIPISSHPSDFEALTPGHFLIGRPIVMSPLSYLPRKIDCTPLEYWKEIDSLTLKFWNRWKSEYLQHLQHVPKWHKQQSLLKIDSLVLIRHRRLPPMCWPLARITKLHTGRDGLVRVVSLKTPSGHVIRAITDVCVLPTN